MVKKVCPNCGNEISFEENAHELKCIYCKREFLIKQNIPNNKEIEYVLVKRVNIKAVNVTTIFVILLLIVACAVVIPLIKMGGRGIEVSAKRQGESNYTNQSSIFMLNDISSTDLIRLKELSYNTIKEHNSKVDSLEIVNDYNSIGQYLCTNSNGKYMIYDVYEATVIVGLKNQVHYYACVLHNNVGFENNKLVLSDNCSIVGNHISSFTGKYSDNNGFLNLYVKGYFTLKEIFDYINSDSGRLIRDYSGSVYYQ